ncbi:Hypothetical predicted protein [Cloeon dipterum]|uniref:Fork-head domain-containing protein n=1 Tax=Cloeon dipterum TaxID=197152 RepID=A0A8S1BTJ2_9INSE|nr:Hypothetical predicted protein [Cloeon dipterum]
MVHPEVNNDFNNQRSEAMTNGAVQQTPLTANPQERNEHLTQPQYQLDVEPSTYYQDQFAPEEQPSYYQQGRQLHQQQLQQHNHQQQLHEQHPQHQHHQQQQHLHHQQQQPQQHHQQQPHEQQQPQQHQEVNKNLEKKRNTSRNNEWGNKSYAELITQAILSPPDQRLTLSEIYDYLIKHFPYFAGKSASGDNGWQNSIRHNLSLHNFFKRTPNENPTKTSWWSIDFDTLMLKKNARKRRTGTENKSRRKKRVEPDQVPPIQSHPQQDQRNYYPPPQDTDLQWLTQQSNENSSGIQQQQLSHYQNNAQFNSNPIFNHGRGEMNYQQPPGMYTQNFQPIQSPREQMPGQNLQMQQMPMLQTAMPLQQQQHQQMAPLQNPPVGQQYFPSEFDIYLQENCSFGQSLQNFCAEHESQGLVNRNKPLPLPESTLPIGDEIQLEPSFLVTLSDEELAKYAWILNEDEFTKYEDLDL